MSSIINTEKFSNMIKSKRGKFGLRKLAREINVSPSTLSRIEKGNLPDIDTYLKVCDWLQVSSDYFLVYKKEVANETRTEVVAHLRADKVLPPETTEALIRMINLAYESAKKEI